MDFFRQYLIAFITNCPMFSIYVIRFYHMQARKTMFNKKKKRIWSWRNWTTELSHSAAAAVCYEEPSSCRRTAGSQTLVYMLLLLRHRRRSGRKTPNKPIWNLNNEPVWRSPACWYSSGTLPPRNGSIFNITQAKTRGPSCCRVAPKISLLTEKIVRGSSGGGERESCVRMKVAAKLCDLKTPQKLNNLTDFSR